MPVIEPRCEAGPAGREHIRRQNSAGPLHRQRRGRGIQQRRHDRGAAEPTASRGAFVREARCVEFLPYVISSRHGACAAARGKNIDPGEGRTLIMAEGRQAAAAGASRRDFRVMVPRVEEGGIQNFRHREKRTIWYRNRFQQKLPQHAPRRRTYPRSAPRRALQSESAKARQCENDPATPQPSPNVPPRITFRMSPAARQPVASSVHQHTRR